ncbi:DUF3343 domain-containing protein [Alkaliphilus transvaalensis]|uniref:DUF3343 domain-containing protein n=1 Tax=Alkaliphilus transvaalensis TaxID=114628 RepID=UPI00054CEEAB|nr:DUF3343 domain-containing protein [Alkaliphilus transvaalensis]
METVYYLAVFDSKNHAIFLQQHLKRNKISGFEMVSTPCKIKAGCSYSIRFTDIDQREILIKEAAKLKIKIASFYEINRSYGRRILNKLS